MRYWFESVLDNINTTRLVIRRNDHYDFERWDHKKKDWVEDSDMAKLLICEMIVDDCTEEKSNQIIERFKHEHND